MAATFEEYIRELARAYARVVVANSVSYDKLPRKLASVAWKRSMEALSKINLDTRKESFSEESIFSDALTKFTIVYEFCQGDLSQDIYDNLIHNENNMRPDQINALFNISGLGSVCKSVSSMESIFTLFGEVDVSQDSMREKMHIELISRLNKFFEKRNQVAHSISAMRSSGPVQILADIHLLRVFGEALSQHLENTSIKLT